MFLEKAPSAVDPYSEKGRYAFIHDCLIILNFIDAVCIEILTERVEEEFMYKTCLNLIISMERVLELLNETLKEDYSKYYPHFLTISLRWKCRAQEEKVTITPPLDITEKNN